MKQTEGWVLAPNEGLLPVRLGMTPEDVAVLPTMGAPMRTFPGGGTVVTEQRGLEQPMVSYIDGKVYYIAMGGSTAGTWFGDDDLFALAPAIALRTLEHANAAPPVLQLEVLHFQSLNVSVSGFLMESEDRFFDPEKDQDDRTIIVQAPGTLQLFDDIPQTSPSFL